MNQRIKFALSLTLGLAAALTLACGGLNQSGGGNDMTKANQLVGEANAADADASKTFEDVNKRLAQLFSDDVQFEDRKKLEPTAKDAVESIDKAQTKVREATDKVDTASKLNIPDWYKEYLTAVAQSYRNTSQTIDLLKQMANTYMDYSITDAEALLAKYKELKESMDKVSKEGADLDAKVKKIEEANKDKLKG
jgi:uncharacterized protein (DUF3084 family)